MRAIFISYRRDDTEGYAGRLFQDLSDRFGKDSVFMDVAGIEPGRDFRRVIEQQVASCGVLLAVIGKAWLTVADAQGKRRLEDPFDFVRLETASALKRDIPVIPVLVQQAEMPRAEQLPDDLKDLAFRNSVELTHARWESDVELLIAALRRYVDPSEPTAAAAPPLSHAAARAGGRQAWVIVPLATLALGGVGYMAWDRLTPSAEETKDTGSTAARTGAASAPAQPVASLPASSAPAPLLAPAPAPLLAGPAPVHVEASVPKRAVANPVAPPPASARPVDRPVAAKAATPALARAPVTESTTNASVPTRSTPVELPAAAAPPPAVLAAAPSAESPSPEAAPPRRDPALDLLGGPGSPSTVTRTIVIKPDTSYVNVTGGEIIRFEVGNKSFLWNFSGQRSSFDLARVAPPSVLDRKVTVYVAPNPMYPRRH